MTEVLLIQAIGFAGMAASLISFQYKEHGKVLFLRILSEIIFAVQYVFLGAYTGMASNLMSAVMNLFFKSRVKGGKSTLAYQIGFSLVFVVLGVITWEGPVSLLIIFAKVASTVSYGIKDTRVMRRVYLLSPPAWVFYDWICGSIAGVLCDLVTLGSVLLAMWRLDRVPAEEN